MKINEGALKIITRVTRYFKEHCTKIDDISLVVIRLLYAKSNAVFIDILDSFRHSLYTFLAFDFYLYSTDFEVHSMPLRLFCKNE